jgi:hypothetical protein
MELLSCSYSFKSSNRSLPRCSLFVLLSAEKALAWERHKGWILPEEPAEVSQDFLSPNSILSPSEPLVFEIPTVWCPL